MLCYHFKRQLVALQNAEFNLLLHNRRYIGDIIDIHENGNRVNKVAQNQGNQHKTNGNKKHRKYQSAFSDLLSADKGLDCSLDALKVRQFFDFLVQKKISNLRIQEKPRQENYHYSVEQLPHHARNERHDDAREQN